MGWDLENFVAFFGFIWSDTRVVFLMSVVASQNVINELSTHRHTPQPGPKSWIP